MTSMALLDIIGSRKIWLKSKKKWIFLALVSLCELIKPCDRYRVGRAGERNSYQVLQVPAWNKQRHCYALARI